MRIELKDLQPKGAYQVALRGSLQSFTSLQDELLGFRETQGISQSQLASELGVSQPMVSKIENSNTEIQVATLMSYAAAMGLSIKFEIEESTTT